MTPKQALEEMCAQMEAYIRCVQEGKPLDGEGFAKTQDRFIQLLESGQATKAHVTQVTAIQTLISDFLELAQARQLDLKGTLKEAPRHHKAATTYMKTALNLQ